VQGIDASEAAARRTVFGRNIIPVKGGPGILRIVARQFRSPLIYVLLVAGVVSIAINETVDAIFILGVLVLNAVIGAFQEWKAETGAKALQETVRVRATVRRGGVLEEEDAAALVPGDVVLLGSGDAVPADLRLLSSSEATADESVLTGESSPVRKSSAAIPDPGITLGDRRNMLHAGTSLVSGRATAVVCSTGGATELGQIAASLSMESAPPPLVVRMKSFTTRLTVMLIGIIAVLAAVNLARGEDISDVFVVAIALAVAAVPEGLPVGVTIALSIASRRMAKRDVIVRLLPAIEGLGACTVIATDKTGTLTVNRMTVKKILLPGGMQVEISGEGLELEGDALSDGQSVVGRRLEEVRRLATTGVLCNEAQLKVAGHETTVVGDTVDAAFLVLGAKLGLSKLELEDAYVPSGGVPFESERRYAAAFHRYDGRTVAHVKGAVEAVVNMCGGIDAELVERRAEELASQGFRVIALAAGPVDLDGVTDGVHPVLNNLEFLGLGGLIDPVRRDVPDAIRRCRAAGVEVKMVTGDHPVTGLAIAEQLGIADDDRHIVHGRELAAVDGDDARLQERIAGARVFARVEPGQKMQIVTSLQRSGHFVAVTGDGVNDAPALRAANIGVAMGRSGTDVARGAADIILTDDNFSSIVNGIEEGRTAYDNVRKMAWLLITTGVGELVLFLLSTIFGLPVPLNAVQLLWLNLVTNGIQDVALAFEGPEPGVLSRPPRPPHEQIFDRRMVRQVAMAGVYMGALAFGVFYWLSEMWGWDEFVVRNHLLLLMVLFENVHVFNSRSEARSAFRVPFSANPFVIASVILAQGLHIGAMYTPGLGDVLEVEPVGPGAWAALFGLALSLLLLVEIYKLVVRKRGHGLPPHPAETRPERDAGAT
jgi:magnesium-transporting ATPase (P-type)